LVLLLIGFLLCASRFFKDIPNTESTVKSIQILGSGKFISGKSFPSGNYDITIVSGNGKVSSDNMFSGGINVVVDKEMYGKKYTNIKLPKGVILTIDDLTVRLTLLK